MINFMVDAHGQDSATGGGSDSQVPPPTARLPWMSDVRPGAMFGPYKLLELLGEGGMGVVWLAEKSEPPKQKVALKLLKSGLGNSEWRARFELEQRVLTRLDHPNIARVLDAGEAHFVGSEQLIPFIALEYVRGEPITSYFTNQPSELSIQLSTFALVCDAIQHAHSRGVIHRDIKPSNILVMQVDGKPVPKVIDFGIARADIDIGMTLHTAQGDVLGTLAYMSPEQADAGPNQITSQSDVYSLGVVLYELLAGSTPFDAAELHKRVRSEAIRMLREVDPQPPSSRLETRLRTRTSATDASTNASRLIVRELRRELDWIPMRALRKEPPLRYRAAADLADDLRRYVEGKPLAAGPDSILYKARKTFRRHRGRTLAIAAVACSVIAGTVTSGYMYSQSRAKAREAQVAAVHRDEMRDALVTILSGKGRRFADDTAASEYATDNLTRLLQPIATSGQVFPSSVQPELKRAAAAYLVSNFHYAKAIPIYHELTSNQTDGAQLTEDLCQLVYCLAQVGGPENLQLATRAIDRATAAGDHLHANQPDFAMMSRIWRAHSFLCDANGDTACALANIAKAIDANSNPDVLADLQRRKGEILIKAKRYDEAVAVFQPLLDSATSPSSKAELYRSLRQFRNIATVFYLKGEYSVAVEVARARINYLIETEGLQSAEIKHQAGPLVKSLMQQGNFREALDEGRFWLNRWRVAPPRRQPLTADWVLAKEFKLKDELTNVLHDLAICSRELGLLADSEDLFVELLDNASSPGQFANAKGELAEVMAMRGNAQAALPIIDATLEALRKENKSTVRFDSVKALVMSNLNRFDEAEQLALSAWNAQKDTIKWRRAGYLRTLLTVYQQSNQPHKCEQFRIQATELGLEYMLATQENQR